ncbi:MAG: DUF3891 family protein [Chloroflexi bacterium]|jgi:hypothetical protein|uniref:DUF3891 domain-containing protein n=1 Tax=Candidatus Thermofonsia Clade 3 bacterium TaxID=2364212 RepID=A0A2M8QEN3_9CHLR|nr:DUF3891 family protein [Candidatus Roseilinea sp. NK_OTU-006]PJF48212.1 MAG: hypothetical protein CUN48_04820 [Candidatus Thermofonsia Clade 3 bacterium]RMG65043.1 MAG: DUF3891 family protein [Chloroflexota bacterium]
MIVQSAPPGSPHFVITQVDHARFSGQFARAFGNRQFAAPQPRELMTYVTAHHDEGWAAVDAAPKHDPRTGLPYHLTQTPMPDLLRTGAGSPDFNQRRHPFCGLLSSMHTYGLYHGRYGLSDTIVINRIPPEYQADARRMLQGELERQASLKAQLRSNPETAEWASDAFLFRCYKLLQFFDMLALYFNTTHATQRSSVTLTHVPAGPDEDRDITITPVGDAYALSPFPFAESGMTFWCEGRYLSPRAEETDWGAVMRETPCQRETVKLIAH